MKIRNGTINDHNNVDTLRARSRRHLEVLESVYNHVQRPDTCAN